MTTNRSSKRQRELLDFVDQFIGEQGYGPSYREIMRALDYKSVSTVAIHIDNLIAKGYLRKGDNSARSLEVVTLRNSDTDPTASYTPSQEKWLVAAVSERLDRLGKNKTALDEAYILVGALKVLGMREAYISAKARLTKYLKTSGSSNK